MSEYSLTYAVFVKFKHSINWKKASDWKENYNDIFKMYNDLKSVNLVVARKIVIKTEALDDYLVEERGNENGNR